MLADARTFYDETPVQRSTAADLDHEAAEEMLAAIRERSQGLDIAGMPQERLLANWGLLAESSGCRVLVFEDRVEVRSPGGLPNSVRLAQLPAGVHVLRNPTLYNLLLKRGLATDAGSGIPRMIQAVRERTGRVPQLGLAGDEFVVTLPRTANETG